MKVGLERKFDTGDTTHDTKLSYRRFAFGAGWTVFKKDYVPTDAQVFEAGANDKLAAVRTKYP